MSFLRPTADRPYGPVANPVSTAGVVLIGVGLLIQGVSWLLKK